jgi:hypothetical protein
MPEDTIIATLRIELSRQVADEAGFCDPEFVISARWERVLAPLLILIWSTDVQAGIPNPDYIDELVGLPSKRLPDGTFP